MNTLQRISYGAAFALMNFSWGMSRVLAQGFAGPIPSIPGTPGAADEGSIRNAILNALKFVLNFLALLAVIFIVVAGIRLIISQGEDEQKDKAKKTILYVIIGLLVILFARVIVGLFTDTIANAV
ncbi:hypothetical protein HYZ99_01815 [Candidatus Peregrinibacteria bacterium]|nr:hypothetical protein [Candidatus Peregrinibacteria bacterium]